MGKGTRKRRGNIVALITAEARVLVARTPEEREEAAADVVVTKFIHGFAIKDEDVKGIEELLRVAERRLRSARKVA